VSAAACYNVSRCLPQAYTYVSCVRFIYRLPKKSSLAKITKLLSSITSVYSMLTNNQDLSVSSRNTSSLIAVLSYDIHELSKISCHMTDMSDEQLHALLRSVFDIYKDIGSISKESILMNLLQNDQEEHGKKKTDDASKRSQATSESTLQSIICLRIETLDCLAVIIPLCGICYDTISG
jgi:hypothetical protein